jgi:Asp-tRNA(Asn)/Glu-tRNA(Gln) amidotransferase C subunit
MTSDYKWHEVSEEEKQKIKENAKKLLDEFSSEIDQIEFKETKKESNENLRKEGSGWKTNEDFREIMMDNAPESDDGLIIAERGGWKK